MSDESWSDRLIGFVWWSRGESNPRPPQCHCGALPTELRPHTKERFIVEESLLVKTKMSSFDKKMNAGHQETFDESIVTRIRLLLDSHTRQVDAVTNRQ